MNLLQKFEAIKQLAEEAIAELQKQHQPEKKLTKKEKEEAQIKELSAKYSLKNKIEKLELKIQNGNR